MLPWFTPLRLALLCTALDMAWAAQALSAVPRHSGSTVEMASLVVWLLAHLPAVLLASGCMKVGGILDGPVRALPAWCFIVTGFLAAAQTFTLTYALTDWWRRSR
jgi:hypothetical protein